MEKILPLPQSNSQPPALSRIWSQLGQGGRRWLVQESNDKRTDHADHWNGDHLMIHQLIHCSETWQIPLSVCIHVCVQHCDHATTPGENAVQLCSTCGLHPRRQVSDAFLTITYHSAQMNFSITSVKHKGVTRYAIIQWKQVAWVWFVVESEWETCLFLFSTSMFELIQCCLSKLLCTQHEIKSLHRVKIPRPPFDERNS